MIKAIIFDCYGVLANDLWKEFVATLPQEKQKSASDLNRALDRGFIDQDEFLNEIISLTDTKPKRIEEVRNPKNNKNYFLLEYIKNLKPKFKIGLLSNVSTDWVKTDFLNKEELKLFDDILLSYELGITKPDNRIFQEAAKRLAVNLDECIFIDDGEQNVQAARELGMKALLYKDNIQCQNEIDSILANTNN